MEIVVPMAALVAAWVLGLLNLRRTKRLIAEIRVLLDAHLRRLERMQNAMAHGVSAVHRSLERIRRDTAEGAGVALLPKGTHAPREPRGACRQRPRDILWATSRSRAYRDSADRTARRGVKRKRGI